MNADFLLALAETAKKASDNQLIVGTFYGYTLTAREHSKFMGQYGAGGFQGGHHAMGRVLRSPHFDILGSPFNYCDRSLGTGLIFEHMALASIHAHGKVFFDENDLWAWNNPPHFEAKTLSVGYTPTIEQTLLIYQVAFMQSMVRGKHQWMMELTDWIGPYQENFSDPQLLAEIKRLNILGEELIQLNRAPQTEMAFMLDEKSIACLRLDNKEFLEKIYKGSVAWGHLGAPFDILLLDDLLEFSEVALQIGGGGVYQGSCRRCGNSTNGRRGIPKFASCGTCPRRSPRKLNWRASIAILMSRSRYGPTPRWWGCMSIGRDRAGCGSGRR